MLLKAEDGLTPICHLLTEIPLSAWLWLQGTAHVTAVVVDIFTHFKVKKKKKWNQKIKLPNLAQAESTVCEIYHTTVV